MIEIHPIQAHQINDAKYVVSAVAQRIFLPENTPQEFYDILEEEKELQDMDDYQTVYENNRGLFLVVTDQEKVVGTGGVKKIDTKTAEIKRLWLLEDYHGLRIGYQIMTRLLDFARENHYQLVRLQTSQVQTRAIAFYKKLGFYQIESYRESRDDLSMEMKLWDQ
jgi:putative acetyltransferase